MPRKQNDVERGLRNKGFVQSESHHHFFIYHSKAGKKTLVKTRTSHGHKEISDDLLRKMANQVHLDKANFIDLIDCPLSRDEYEKILIAKRLVAVP